MNGVLRTTSQHDLPFDSQAVWSILSRTDWLNRSLGLPQVDYAIQPRTEGGSATTATARFLGLEMRWQELPFEWLEPEFHRVRRIFETGPFREVRLGIDFLEQPGGATRVVAYSEIIPRNILGSLLARWVLGPKARRDMQRIVAHAEEFLRGHARAMLPRLPVQPVNESALQSGLKKLGESGQPPEMIRRLEEFLRKSPDVELTHIRPLAVARAWGRDEWETLMLFLHGPGCGLLDLRWEVLCPNCRSSRQPPARSLRQIRRGAHCDVCQIEFDAEFDKSVELKFMVNSAIRPSESQTFCLAGPGGKPHVVSQLWLQPREERLWKCPAANGSLRLRSPQVKKSVAFRPGNSPTLTEQMRHRVGQPAPPQSGGIVARNERWVITCDANQFVLGREPSLDADGPARIQNPNPFPILVSWEATEWSEDILTAARVTNWQEFRDLFASEVVSPDEQVTIGSQVVLFTDLRGSTAMYRGLGDAPAYAKVRDHFSIVMEAVRAEHGAVVKTIGDAVMATFSRVDEALSAVRQMHRELAATASGSGERLVLKSSLHVGACLAVNANDRLDYFGTTVNLAARMIECSQGGDLVVSDEFFRRPETTKFLEGTTEAPSPAEVKFRGFEAPHRVWRIPMR